MTSLITLMGESVDTYIYGYIGLEFTRDDVYAALDGASGGPVVEGCVGAGTGMQLFDFKGGIGTSSRIVQAGLARYTVGALVMTNFGARHELRIDGVPAGRMLSGDVQRGVGEGSCIVVLATDAPLHARQCQRLAK